MFFQASFFVLLRVCASLLHLFSNTIFYCSKVCFFVGGGVRRPGGRAVAAVFQNKKMENMKIKAKKDRPDNNRALLLLAE